MTTVHKRSHESAHVNGSHSNASIVPFAVDTLVLFALLLLPLKAIAKQNLQNLEQSRSKGARSFQLDFYYM